LKGWLSWRREVKDDKTYFNVSLNKPQVVAQEEVSKSPDADADTGVAPAGWGYSDESPF
jgi:hypothetical protein